MDAQRVCEKLIWTVQRFSILIKSGAFRCDFLKGKYSSAQTSWTFVKDGFSKLSLGCYVTDLCLQLQLNPDEMEDTLMKKTTQNPSKVDFTKQQT